MESEYIRKTVGPAVAEALSSLLHHIPQPGDKESSYDTTIDPIAYIAHYLMNHEKSQETERFAEKKRNYEKAVSEAFAAEEEQILENRRKLDVGLVERLSVIKSDDIPALDQPVIQLIPDTIPETPDLPKEILTVNEIAVAANVVLTSEEVEEVNEAPESE